MKNVMVQINQNGNLPWKNSKGRWCVTYLCRQAEGVCDAEFDTIFEAMEFAKDLIVR